MIGVSGITFLRRFEKTMIFTPKTNPLAVMVLHEVIAVTYCQAMDSISLTDASTYIDIWPMLLFSIAH